MLVKSVSALAVIALAAHVSAAPEKMPYKPLMKMSVHEMFGVARRQSGGDGYQPTQSVCGEGATCAQACGAGYDTCASSDTTIHCYNPAAKQTCCPDNTGNSCDDGYYCTADSAGQTWCCPDGTDLAACAALFSVTGSLVSETPKPTTSSTSASSSSSSVVTTTSSSSSSTFLAQNSTTTATSSGTVTTCTSTLGSSATWAASNTTTTHKTPSVVATTTPSTVSSSGAGTVGAAGALSLLAAAAIAALL